MCHKHSFKFRPPKFFFEFYVFPIRRDMRFFCFFLKISKVFLWVKILPEKWILREFIWLTLAAKSFTTGTVFQKLPELKIKISPVENQSHTFLYRGKKSSKAVTCHSEPIQQRTDLKFSIYKMNFSYFGNFENSIFFLWKKFFFLKKYIKSCHSFC